MRILTIHGVPTRLLRDAWWLDAEHFSPPPPPVKVDHKTRPEKDR